MTNSKSITLFETKDFGVRVEYNSNFVIVHLPFVNRMSKEVILEMKAKLDEWYEFFSTLGYQDIWAALDPSNDKMVKLVGMLGFKFKGVADNMSVYSYRS